MARLARLLAWWQAAQVELHGHYSIAQLQEFEHYHSHTTWLRVALVCLLTPVPSIVLVLAVDCLPLEPPEVGTRKSPHVWIRNVFTVFQCTLCMCEQFRQHLPRLQLTRWQMVPIAFAATGTSVPFCYSLSLVIGYPLPFAMVIGTVPWSITIFAMIIWFSRHQFRDHASLASDFVRYAGVGVCQITMTIIYPVYNYVYKSLSSSQQTGFVLLLPVIKILAKNWISRLLPDSDDAKPEAVVFNVEIFHALFVALCMGSTTSKRTVVALMAIDLIQAWLAFQDMLVYLNDLKPIVEKLDKSRGRTDSTVSSSRHGLRDLVAISNRIIQAEPFQARPGTRSREKPRYGTHWSLAGSSLVLATRQAVESFRQRLSRGSRTATMDAAPTKHDLHKMAGGTESGGGNSTSGHANGVFKPASVVPLPPPVPPQLPGDQELLLHRLPSDLASLNIVERGVVVRQTQKVLFVTEFIVLIEYVEVIMPVMYNIYVVAMFYLPNRAYYPFLDGVNTVSDLIPTISNVLLYALLEFLSLITMAVIVWYKLRLSLAHQLAFVLEKRASNIQVKLLLWVLDVMQNAVIQLGPDYSMRFEWLHTKVPLASSPAGRT